MVKVKGHFGLPHIVQLVTLISIKTVKVASCVWSLRPSSFQYKLMVIPEWFATEASNLVGR